MDDRSGCLSGFLKLALLVGSSIGYRTTLDLVEEHPALDADAI